MFDLLLRPFFFCHKTCLQIIFWLIFSFWPLFFFSLTVHLSCFSVFKLSFQTQCFTFLLQCFCRVRVSVKRIKLLFDFAEFFNVSNSCFFYHRHYMMFSLTTLQWMQSISKEKTSIRVILTFPFNVDRMTNGLCNKKCNLTFFTWNIYFLVTIKKLKGKAFWVN